MPKGTIPSKKARIPSDHSEDDTDSELSCSDDYDSDSDSTEFDEYDCDLRNNELIFNELVDSQLHNVPEEWKLSVNDIKRICKYINSSIFDETKCCKWNGYITNINNSHKGTYVNFYFRNKKVALHRLLYSNFVEPLDSSEYLKFNCDNKGICCNVNHYEKYKYSKRSTTKKSKKKHKSNTAKCIVHADNDLVVEFD